MKGLIVVLLILIASGVGYLAYSKYQERQLATGLAEEFVNPGAYVVNTWAKRAELECAYGVADIITRQAPGGTIPVSFVCKASNGSWLLQERRCSEAQSSAKPGSEGLARGEPKNLGDVFRPLYSMCWEVAEKR